MNTMHSKPADESVCAISSFLRSGNRFGGQEILLTTMFTGVFHWRQLNPAQTVTPHFSQIHFLNHSLG